MCQADKYCDEAEASDVGEDLPIGSRQGRPAAAGAAGSGGVGTAGVPAGTGDEKPAATWSTVLAIAGEELPVFSASQRVPDEVEL